MILLKIIQVLQSVNFLLFSLYFTHCFAHFLRINPADKMSLLSTGSQLFNLERHFELLGGQEICLFPALWPLDMMMMNSFKSFGLMLIAYYHDYPLIVNCSMTSGPTHNARRFSQTSYRRATSASCSWWTDSSR